MLPCSRVKSSLVSKKFIFGAHITLYLMVVNHVILPEKLYIMAGLVLSKTTGYKDCQGKNQYTDIYLNN